MAELKYRQIYRVRQSLSLPVVYAIFPDPHLRVQMGSMLESDTQAEILGSAHQMLHSIIVPRLDEMAEDGFDFMK